MLTNCAVSPNLFRLHQALHIKKYNLNYSFFYSWIEEYSTDSGTLVNHSSNKNILLFLMLAYFIETAVQFLTNFMQFISICLSCKLLKKSPVKVSLLLSNYSVPWYHMMRVNEEELKTIKFSVELTHQHIISWNWIVTKMSIKLLLLSRAIFKKSFESFLRKNNEGKSETVSKIGTLCL